MNPILEGMLTAMIVNAKLIITQEDDTEAPPVPPIASDLAYQTLALAQYLEYPLSDFWMTSLRDWHHRQTTLRVRPAKT